MEEFVGKVWDRVISRAARQDYPAALVRLEDIHKTAGVMFRALGGDRGLRIETAHATRSTARRNWLQRLAGSGRRVELAWRDEHLLRLPAAIAVFPQAELNRDLYLWLAALAAQANQPTHHWFTDNQWYTVQVLQHYPGMLPRYQRLVAAQLALRPDANRLPADAAQQERAIVRALQTPGQVTDLPDARQPPAPVWLWLHPSPPTMSPSATEDLPENDQEAASGESRTADDARRRQAERVSLPKDKHGLVIYRFESLFSWTEFAKVDRSTDEEDDLDAANQVLDDLDHISIARDERHAAKRLRFDLDLPAAAYDDIPLGKGIVLPEWDYRARQLKTAQCCVQPMLAADTTPSALPAHLRRPAQRLRAQFESLRMAPTWLRAQPDGTEIDLDAYLSHVSQSLRGDTSRVAGLYRDRRQGERDIATLVLADLSLSTDSWVNNEMRVIDVIRDALHLFAEALSVCGDRFALYGFSSRYRQHVRINWLKGFNETYNAVTRGRLASIKPGYYTRMGAAIRYATQTLERQPANQRLLLLLTDGKPNDLDHYEGRYGAEDTRQAIREARQKGIKPFCVTIDAKAASYLPHLFGGNGFVVIRHAVELPQRLPALYAQLTHS